MISPAFPASGFVEAVKARYQLNGGGSPAFAQCGPLPPEVTLSTVIELAAAQSAG